MWREFCCQQARKLLEVEREAQSRTLPGAFQESNPTYTLISDFQPPESETTNFCCLSLSGCGTLLCQPHDTDSHPSSWAPLPSCAGRTLSQWESQWNLHLFSWLWDHELSKLPASSEVCGLPFLPICQKAWRKSAFQLHNP